MRYLGCYEDKMNSMCTKSFIKVLNQEGRKKLKKKDNLEIETE